MISSLSILGDGHPFIPLNSPLRGVFERDIGRRCRIIAGQMDTSQAFPPQNLKPTWHYVTSVAFSPDGRCLASSDLDGNVRIWDAATGGFLQELERHNVSAQWVAFSPDGHHLASGSGDHTVHVWDAATGAHLRRLNGRAAWVRAIAFSPDGCHLASSSGDRTVCVWDTATGVRIKELRHDDAVLSVAFSPDGHYLASALWDRIHVWDFAKGSPVIQKRLEYSLYRSKISFSADGSVLRVEFPKEPPVTLHFPSLELIDNPVNPHPSPFYLDENSLCVKHQGLTLRLCWLPDYFRPTTPVTQHGNRVCIGGYNGMIAFVDLDQFALPDL